MEPVIRGRCLRTGLEILHKRRCGRKLTRSRVTHAHSTLPPTSRQKKRGGRKLPQIQFNRSANEHVDRVEIQRKLSFILLIIIKLNTKKKTQRSCNYWGKLFCPPNGPARPRIWESLLFYSTNMIC